MKETAGGKGRVIYVCHEFGTSPRVHAARIRKLCRALVQLGVIPLAPQLLLPQFLNEESERDLAMSCCLRLLARAEEVWVFGPRSKGMAREIAEAERLEIPVVRKPLP